jgi:hypothetical protein
MADVTRRQVIKPGELRAEVVPSGHQFGFKIQLFRQGRKRPIGTIQAQPGDLSMVSLKLATRVQHYRNDDYAICLVRELPRRRSRAKELPKV